MPLVLSNVNYEDKDLDWFLNDNPLNEVLYEHLCVYDDSMDFDKIFNEAYKICTRVYEEKHPEQHLSARFGFYDGFPDSKEQECSWGVALAILNYNYALMCGTHYNFSAFVKNAKKIFVGRSKMIEDLDSAASVYFSSMFVRDCGFAYSFKYEYIHSLKQLLNGLDKTALFFEDAMESITLGFSKVGVLQLIESVDSPKEKLNVLNWVEELFHNSKRNVGTCSSMWNL